MYFIFSYIFITLYMYIYYLTLLARRAYIYARNYFLSPRRAYNYTARVKGSMLLPPLLTLVSFSCVVGVRHIPLDVAIAVSVRFAT